MNTDNLTIGTIVVDNNGYNIKTADGLHQIATTSSTITSGYSRADIDNVLDKWVMNKVVVDHKVTSHEFLKMKETTPDFAAEIKVNLTKEAARVITDKMSFTKKLDVDQDVHHFIGRVWIFTEEELVQLIKGAV